MHCIPVFPHKGRQRQGKPGVCVVSSRPTRTTNTQEHLALGGRSLVSMAIVFSFLFNLFMCFICMCVCTPHVCLVPKEEPKGGTGSPSTGVKIGCEPPCVFWGLDLSPL